MQGGGKKKSTDEIKKRNGVGVNARERAPRVRSGFTGARGAMFRSSDQKALMINIRRGLSQLINQPLSKHCQMELIQKHHWRAALTFSAAWTF